MKKGLIFIFAVLFIGQVFAVCNSGQVDINSASLSDLMTITNLGGKGIIAQKVIDDRPYSSLEELIKVSGIGNTTLSEIKAQGIACVGPGSGQENVASNSTPTASPSANNISYITKTDSPDNGPSIIQPKIISLNANTSAAQDAKAIKSGDVIGNSGSKALYWFVAFSVVIIALLLMKRKKYKNEFQD